MLRKDGRGRKNVCVGGCVCVKDPFSDPNKQGRPMLSKYDVKKPGGELGPYPLQNGSQ